MRIMTLPGVFRPISDSRLLADCARKELSPAASALDVCTGSGAIAIAAARAGAGSVTAVDASRRAVLSARMNARLNGVAVRVLQGDLLEPVRGERFDLIVSNPPYVPALDQELPARGAARAWDAGLDGRVFIDRLCDEGPACLAPGGALLLVHSSVCGEGRTLELLQRRGLEADVVARRPGPLGPLMRERAGALEARGLLEPGQREEELLVIRGRRAARATASSSRADVRPAPTQAKRNASPDRM